MSILGNAIDSIAVGLDDYASSDPRRLVSATRNIYAGVLLLFKHKLALLSPTGSDEVLLKQKVLPLQAPDGQIIWKGTGQKTVDTWQIQERFKALGVKVDWTRVTQINEYRNEIEHYFSAKTKASVRKLIADCFIVIRDFIAEHLQQDPKDLLGQDAWGKLLQVSEVHEREKSDCLATLEAVAWGSPVLEAAIQQFHCSECGSDLLFIKSPQSSRVDNNFTCKSCNKEWRYESFAAEALEAWGAVHNYRSMKDGGELEIVRCPSCDEESYIFSEEHCGVCGETAEHHCERCGCDIPASELHLGGICGYCEHMLSKDD